MTISKLCHSLVASVRKTRSATKSCALLTSLFNPGLSTEKGQGTGMNFHVTLLQYALVDIVHISLIILSKSSFMKIRRLDDGSSTHLWNVGLLQRDDTALYPRMLSSSYSPPWEPEISQFFFSSLMYVKLNAHKCKIILHISLPYVCDTFYIVYLSQLPVEKKTRFLLGETERRDRMVSTPTSHSGSSIGSGTGYPEIFCGFPQSCQANNATVR
jgi:hypothetical protein